MGRVWTEARSRTSETTVRIAVLATAWCLAFSVLTVSPVEAETLEYVVDVPEGQPITFVLEFRPTHPGVLEVDAEWSGTRQLSFRLEGPGEPVVKGRRFGPSPQRMRVPVDDAVAGRDQIWNLVIRALPARGEAQGTVRIVLPEFEYKPPPTTPIQQAVPTPPAEFQTWARSASAPADAGVPVVKLFEAVEQLRFWMVDPAEGLRPDPCGWQSDTLRYLATVRDGVTDGSTMLEESTSRFLGRLAAVVEDVDDLRTSTDPMLSGPAPDGAVERRAWLRMRQERIHPLEAELDSFGEGIRRGHAPDLENEEWPQRFIGCLMACERYFEQRPRLGADRATNQALATDQWDGFLAAGRAIEALASATGGPTRADVRVPPVPDTGAR